MTSTVQGSIRGSSPGRGDWKETLGRVGLVGKGVLFAVVGLLAIQLATGGASEEASTSGAIEWIGSQPFGKFLLVALTLSLFAMAVWRALDAWLGDPVEGSEGKDRVKYAVEAVIYAALGVVALTQTISNWSGTAQDSQQAGAPSGEQKAAATVFEWPGGQWLVVIAGIAAIAGAIYVIKKHVVDEEFLERLEVGNRSWVSPFGRFGYAARAVIAVLVGWFLIQAGLSYDPNEAKGLSAVLQELAGEGWGKALLWLIAIGLIAAGLFSMAEAKLRRAA